MDNAPRYIYHYWGFCPKTLQTGCIFPAWHHVIKVDMEYQWMCGPRCLTGFPFCRSAKGYLVLQIMTWNALKCLSWIWPLVTWFPLHNGISGPDITAGFPGCQNIKLTVKCMTGHHETNITRCIGNFRDWSHPELNLTWSLWLTLWRFMDLVTIHRSINSTLLPVPSSAKRLENTGEWKAI